MPAGAFALSNYLHPDAAHPHFFTNITRINTPTYGLLLLSPPDPAWRNPSDCGTATYTRTDGSVIPLNCGGPRHVYLRDVDGSLTGGHAGSTVLGAYPEGGAGQRPAFDQGSNVISGRWVSLPVRPVGVAC